MMKYIKKFYRCQKCGYKANSPGTCPNCSGDIK